MNKLIIAAGTGFLGQVLANHIRQELGFQIVYAQTPCMILDAVSVPNPNYPDLNAFIIFIGLPCFNAVIKFHDILSNIV